MAIIEKKYLLKETLQTLIEDAHVHESITQFYTKIKLCKEVRFQKQAQHYSKTTRSGNEIKKIEKSNTITKDAYLKAKENMIGNVLKKERYTLNDHYKNFVIDRYQKNLNPLYILAVTFKDINQAEDFILPDIFKPYVLKEVSDDARYSDKNLARLGNPHKHDYNLYAVFKDIEQGRLHDVNDVFFEEMIVSDAVRIVLFKMYHDLRTDAQNLIHDNHLQSLEAFRENLKKTKLMLKEFYVVFDRNMHKKVLYHLSMIEKTIEIDKDLSAIRENLQLLESAFSEKEINVFISQIDKRIDAEKHKVKHFFKTREFSIIFDQFQALISQPSHSNTTYYNNTSIGEVSRASVQKHFKKVLRLYKKYDKCYDLDSYKKIRKAILNTNVFMENFATFYDKKRFKKMQKLLAQSDENMLDFIELNKRSLIIKTYIRNSKKSLQKQQKLINKVIHKRKSMEKQINQKIDHSMELLREQKALFKK